MTTPKSTKRPTTPRQVAPKTSEKKRKTDQLPNDDVVDSVLKTVSETLLAPDPQKDEDEIFGDLVTSRLRKLKPGRAKMMAEKMITDTLYNAALEQEKSDHYTAPRGYYHTQQMAHPTVGHGAAPHAPAPSTSGNYSYADAQHYIGNVPSSTDQPIYTNLDNQQFRPGQYPEPQTPSGSYPQEHF